MEEVKQQCGTPELLPKEKKSKLPLILAALLLLLAGAYAALCVWVSANGTILPNVQVGDTPVGGMTVEAAAEAIRARADDRFASCETELEFGQGQVLRLSGDHITADGQAAALQAYAVGRDTSPLLYGLGLLKALTAPTVLELPLTYDSDGEDIFAVLDGAFLKHEYAVAQPSYTVEETELRVRKGTAGLRYDREETARILLQNLVTAAEEGKTIRTRIEPVRTEPDPVDWSALARRVYVAPADAALNTETREIVPSVTGVSLDTALAKELYDRAGEGETLTIPLTFTEPRITTELLFRDTLGEVTSWISGVENRVKNVTMAAAACNDIILMPGDEFSYWDTCGPFSSAQGYLPAPSYVNGATVDSIAGGVCQVSSSIYYAALKANLEIVERQHHTYAVGYVPDGADATVYSGSPDFRFKNNTDYPIRILTFTKGRNLTVRLQGTKTDGTYVKMTFVELSRTPYTTVYKADATIPAGTTKVSVTPYTGRKVEAYRCVYNEDGTLLSKTLESVNNYKKRDEVILCNPEELHLYDPTVPAPSPSAEPSPEPSASAEPVPGGTPAPSDSPLPSETPAPDGSPLPTESAAPSQAPAASPSAEPTPAPAGEAEGTVPETEE